MICTDLYYAAPDKAYKDNTVPYDPNKPRMKDIIWRNHDWLEEIDESGRARKVILDTLDKTLLCNTCYLGYDFFECPKCDDWLFLYRKCHSRFCSSCGVKLQKSLALKAEVMCINVKHRHMVFTIPEEYRIIFRKDRSALDLLFVASRNTLAKMFNTSLFNKLKRKRGIVTNNKDNYYFLRNFKGRNEFGEIATLHTFGRDLKWNPHIHALVPELYYDHKKDKIVHLKHFNYESLRHVWMYEVNRLLKERYPNSKDIKRIIDNEYKKRENGFYVYAKADLSDDDKYTEKIKSKNIKGCVNYMMRYAGRPVMAESRLTSYDKNTDIVEWYYEDHKTEERIEVVETGRSLLEKLIIHIPDENYRMVRYYGFYNNKCQKLLDKIHELLGKEGKLSLDRTERKNKLKAKFKLIRFRQLSIDTYNRDPLKCKCGSIMNYIWSYNPLEKRINDREYRKECIDEMRHLRIPRVYV